jgi:O-antigen/teichoic acid export membrane protein
MNKYLKAVSFNFTFFILSTMAYLILTPLAIHIMGNEFFGLWSIIFAIAQLTNIGTLGIGSIVNKFASENKCTDSD